MDARTARTTRTATPSPRPAPADPARTLRRLKRATLGATVLVTAAVGGLVVLHPAGAAPAPLAADLAPAGPVVTAADPFFERSSASIAGSRIRRSASMAFLGSGGS